MSYADRLAKGPLTQGEIIEAQRASENHPSPAMREHMAKQKAPSTKDLDDSISLLTKHIKSVRKELPALVQQERALADLKSASDNETQQKYRQILK